VGSYPSGTNLAFGGPDGKTLLVVGLGTQVREIQMNLPGLP
jgi:sugar lactone lactonase YvrE